MNKPDFLKLIFAGIFLGALAFFAPISFLLFFMLGCIATFLASRDPVDRAILTKIVVVGLILRLIFSFISMAYLPIFYIHYSKPPFFMRAIGHTLQLFRDFHREILNGINMGRYFSGEYGEALLNEVLKEVAIEGKTSFLHLGAYIQGILNFVFGESLLNILVYPLLGIWAVVLIYYLAKEIFNRNVAIMASFILAILPSFIIWSCINVRMAIAINSILLMMWSLVKFGRVNYIKYLIPFSIGLLFFNLAKDKFTMPLILISIFLLFLCINFKRKIKKMLTILTMILMVPIILMAFKSDSIVHSKMDDLIMKIMTNQRSFALYKSGNNYKIYDDFIYVGTIEVLKPKITIFTLLKGLPKGIAYFLFAPFPWKVTNTLRLYAYPQTLFWFFIFPFSLWGIFIGFIHNRRDTLSLLLFSIFWILLCSLTLGNEGTAARHKDFISPFFYIFASAAFCSLFGLLKTKE